ncbi:MAG: MgtC/SapB family protein [Bacillota bacterium]|nr:MgtC/SapB family protein [Clostridia bacterium]
MEINLQWELAFRLLFALIIGGLVGSERHLHHKPAGARTHSLVCLASALFMIISIYGFIGFDHSPAIRRDPARLAAQVISGMGFIGAGVIWKEGVNIKGLTTATTLWLVCGLGLASGCGMYIPALLSAVLAYIALNFFHTWETALMRKRHDRIKSSSAGEFNIKELKQLIENAIGDPLRYDVSGESENPVLSFRPIRSQNDPFLLTLGVKEEILQIFFLRIPKTKRERGLGGMVVDILINWCRKNNLCKISLVSTSETMGFWLRNGFKQIDDKTFVYDLENTRSDAENNG